MHIRFTRAVLLSAAILVVAAGIALSGGVPAAVHYIAHDKVAEVMAKGGPIVSDPGLIVLAQRRGTGDVELHEKTNHVFIIVDGEAADGTDALKPTAKTAMPAAPRMRRPNATIRLPDHA